MNNKHAQVYRRLGKRFNLRIGGIIALVLVICVLCILLRPARVTQPRVSWVVAGSPVSVWSWDTVHHTFTVLSFPSDYAVDAVYGYGQYSLESLWKLGFIDRKDGSLLSESIGDVVGISVPWYIGERISDMPEVSDVISYGRRLFSYQNTVRFAFGAYRSNLPLGLFFGVAAELAGTTADKITLIDMAKKNITEIEELPDGTKQNRVITKEVDVVCKGLFEDEKIREEGFTVALFNTTEVPSLGFRTARILSALGMMVVSVGNRGEGDAPLSRCQILADTQSLASYTVAQIGSQFHCEKKPARSDKRADIEVYIGTQYSDRFVPVEVK